MPLDVAPEPVVAGLIPLSRIEVGQRATIRQVRVDASDTEGGEIGLRLLELGFVEGELLRVIAHGLLGLRGLLRPAMSLPRPERKCCEACLRLANSASALMA